MVPLATAFVVAISAAGMASSDRSRAAEVIIGAGANRQRTGTADSQRAEPDIKPLHSSHRRSSSESRNSNSSPLGRSSRSAAFLACSTILRDSIISGESYVLRTS